MRIALFGIELMSNNYGCAALGLTQLQYLERIAQEKNIKLEYYIFSNDDKNKVDEIKNNLSIESKIYIKKLISFRQGINVLKEISKEIKKCDLVIDLTYGDSFSDIYGLKNYILYTLPKLITLYNKKKLVIGPQTIGPYKSKIVRYISKRILKKCSYLCVRDEQSFNIAKKLSNREDIILTSDLAMELPFKKTVLYGQKFKVGINISDLLWSNSYKENKKKYGIVVDYKELIKNIINKFNNENYEIHLITHVFSKDDTKGEYALAKKINQMYPYTILAPKFNNPIEAKNYMSGLNLFLGSRMHATIGAFSSGVPVIPISYSRKFEGLYESLNYNYGINLRDTTIENSIKQIEISLKNYEKMKYDLNVAFQESIERNKKYRKLLSEIIYGGKNDNTENKKSNNRNI